MPHPESHDLLDNVGSVTAITNASAQVVWKSEYQPFGTTAGIQGTYEFDGGYTGKDLDDATGLIYMWHRWQDPSTGSFISEDPIRDGNNWYSYCDGNPVSFTDPTGLDGILVIKTYDSKTGELIGFTSDNAKWNKVMSDLTAGLGVPKSTPAALIKTLIRAGGWGIVAAAALSLQGDSQWDNYELKNAVNNLNGLVLQSDAQAEEIKKK